MSSRGQSERSIEVAREIRGKLDRQIARLRAERVPAEAASLDKATLPPRPNQVQSGANPVQSSPVSPTAATESSRASAGTAKPASPRRGADSAQRATNLLS